MNLIADILLIAGALGAGIYCIVLSKRLSRFTDLEKGVGGAIAALSSQVDDMTKALETSRQATAQSASTLSQTTGRAEGVAQRLELLVSALHDLPLEEKATAEKAQAEEDEADQALFQSQRSKLDEAAE